jgi:quinolinate synthase
MEIVKEIDKWKKQRNALILAHLYQRPEIQNIADLVGDSLDLSKKARDTEADVIVFCGVWFMAETAKILNPQKTVLIPNPEAGCPMADMVKAGDVMALRQKYPDAAVVCYVNSSAAVKAVSDICCTSSNAIKVVKSLKEKRVIFVPDRNLGHYISRFVRDKEIILFDGYCPTHQKISLDDTENMHRKHFDAPILAHPECPPEVLDEADFVGSTKQIIDFVADSEKNHFIIGTEGGVLHKLKQRCPEKEFYLLQEEIVCPDMKKTDLVSLSDALKEMKYEVNLDSEVIKRASLSLERMLALS